MIQEAIRKLADAQTLTEEEAAAATEDIMTGEATPTQIGAFLMALRLHGETVDEITGMAKVMRQKALRVPTDGQLVDVVGTGGDGLRTFNVSTASALVVAAARGEGCQSIGIALPPGAWAPPTSSMRTA